MAYAQEMKNLVAEIKTSHQDRTQYVKNVIKDATKMLEDNRVWVKGVKEDTAKILKDNRAWIEGVKKDTARIRKDNLARIKEIKEDTADLLTKIAVDNDTIRKAVRAEIKEAAGYLGRLKAREEAALVAEVAEAAPKKKRGRGKK
jgi:hypothetical protein